MKCPACGANNDKVIDSRYRDKHNVIYRRRECISCGCKFTTYEMHIPDTATGEAIVEELGALNEEAAMREKTERMLVSARIPFAKDVKVT